MYFYTKENEENLPNGMPTFGHERLIDCIKTYWTRREPRKKHQGQNQVI